jgi:hypothetical protein
VSAFTPRSQRRSRSGGLSVPGAGSGRETQYAGVCRAQLFVARAMLMSMTPRDGRSRRTAARGRALDALPQRALLHMLHTRDPRDGIKTLHALPHHLLLLDGACTPHPVHASARAHRCPQTCQTGDWALHKRECASLQVWAKAAPEAALAVPPEAVRCLARVLWLRRDQGEDSIWVSPGHMRRAMRTDDLRACRPGRWMLCSHVRFSPRDLCATAQPDVLIR